MTDETETPDGLAAEYVLGTLGADERAQVEALIGNDPAFARLVRRWERRLGELHAMMHSVEPPPDTWARIQARIGAAPRAATLVQPDQAVVAAPESNVVALSARLHRWRQVAAGLGALAAVMVALIAIQAFNPAALPGPLRPKPIEIVKTIATPVNPGRFVAVLQQNAASPAFILTVDVATRTASVRRVSAEQPAGKSYELWLVSDRFPAPQSLGLVGASEFARPALASYDPATVSSATYAVSLEPEGGSPTGAPTGPILFTGKLVESVPPSP